MTRPPPRADRQAREAAALRQNLLRRKDQARRRETAPGADQENRDGGNQRSQDSGAAPNDSEADSP